MPPKLELLQDPFTAPAIDTGVWNSITGGTATLDTVNDLVSLAQPTTSGATNNFGTTSVWDATSSEIYAQIGVSPTGNGATSTALRLILDANNSISMRLRAGNFELARQTAGTTVTTALGSYDPHAHRWWRIRESGGSFFAEASADSWTWVTLGSTTYSWAATALQVAFQTSASATEAPGNVATIQNVNTILGGPHNPAWPQIEHGFGARWNCNGGDSPLDRYSDVSLLTRGSQSISRGRQYELDQVQSGEHSGALANPEGIWDPNNSAGLYYGHLMPYQPYRMRAQWPRTRNLLTQVQASGGDVGGYALGTIPQGNAGISTFSGTDTSGGSIVASSSAWSGGRVFQFAVPSGTIASQTICYTPQPAGERLGTYTMSMRIRNVTPSTSLQVHPYISSATAGQVGTITQGSNTTLSGSATAAWSTITVTATLGADGAYLLCGVRLNATAAATCTIQVDGWQLERGSVATPWTCPGAWYPMYAGFAERYPPSWEGSGTYGLVTPTVVDALALLSQSQLTDPLTAEVNLNQPRFLYALNDPAGSATASDTTGNFPGVPLAIGKYGAGSLVFGTAITATDPVGGIYTGATDTVATVNNPNPGTNTISGATFLRLTSAGITGPVDPTRWTRMLAFRYTGPTPTSGAYLWSSMDRQRAGGVPSGSHIYVYLDTSGKPTLSVQGPTGVSVASNFGGATNCVDGNWHLLIFGYNQATSQVVLSQDGSTTAYIGGLSPDVCPTGIIGDNLGGFVDVTVGNGTFLNFKGDIAVAAEFSTFFNIIQIPNMYTAWKAACAGESSDARYARILRYAGYTGPSSIQTGLTTSMGPATSLSGQDGVSALQAVVDTESGEHFVARDGSIVFRSRSARYNATTPALIFGERTDLGEWPYEDIQPDYDSTHLANQVTVTQEGTGQAFYAQDQTSITNYFPRPLTRTINSSDPLECQDAAGYLLSRYRNPSMRIANLRLHPSAMPSLWPAVLGLELGTRARVMRRPPGIPPVAIDCYIEKIDWELGEDNEAWVTLQCSPADITPYAVFAAWHTTLASSIGSGVSSITLNRPQDNVNLLSQQIAPGQQLVLGQGTANAETVTVLVVGSTSSGWTTGTLTLTAATTKAHTSGDVVCEPLPAGTTDPTTWDTTVFDNTAFAY